MESASHAAQYGIYTPQHKCHVTETYTSPNSYTCILCQVPLTFLNKRFFFWFTRHQVTQWYTESSSRCKFVSLSWQMCSLSGVPSRWSLPPTTFPKKMNNKEPGRASPDQSSDFHPCAKWSILDRVPLNGCLQIDPWTSRTLIDGHASNWQVWPSSGIQHATPNWVSVRNISLSNEMTWKVCNISSHCFDALFLQCLVLIWFGLILLYLMKKDLTKLIPEWRKAGWRFRSFCMILRLVNQLHTLLWHYDGGWKVNQGNRKPYKMIIRNLDIWEHWNVS